MSIVLAVISAINDSSPGGMEEQEDRHGEVDATPTAATGAEAVCPEVRSVQVDGDAGGGRGGIAQGPPLGHSPRYQTTSLP